MRSQGAATLNYEEIAALTEQDFSEDIAADEEDDTLVVDDEVEARLTQYLALHGLRLPTEANGDHVLRLYTELRWTYGKPIRLAAKNRLDIAVVCPDLSAEQIAYARAVASQRPGAARLAARKVFKGPERIAFLY